MESCPTHTIWLGKGHWGEGGGGFSLVHFKLKRKSEEEVVVRVLPVVCAGEVSYLKDRMSFAI